MESNFPINILNAFGKANFFFSQENNEEIKISIFTTVLIVKCKYKIDKIKNKSLISFVRKLLDKLSFIKLMNSFSYENNGLCGQIKLMFNKSLLGIIYFFFFFFGGGNHLLFKTVESFLFFNFVFFPVSQRKCLEFREFHSPAQRQRGNQKQFGFSTPSIKPRM